MELLCISPSVYDQLHEVVCWPAMEIAYKYIYQFPGILQPKMLVSVHTSDRDLSKFKKTCSEANPTTDIVMDQTLYLV